MNTYGVLINGVHEDVSSTLRGAKNFATRNGFLTVTERFNCGYIAREVAHKYTGKWREIKEGQHRYLGKNKDVLPPSGMYKEFLMIQANREGITLEECRALHGLKTIKEWEQLLNF